MHDPMNGLFGLAAAIICSGICITIVTGSFFHWPALLLGIGVGLWAVQSMSKS